MNINETRFKTVIGGAGCKGCVFQHLTYRDCVTAADEAVRRGMPDCDDPVPNARKKTYIYVLDESDPRQLPLLTAVKEVV